MYQSTIRQAREMGCKLIGIRSDMGHFVEWEVRKHKRIIGLVAADEDECIEHSRAGWYAVSSDCVRIGNFPHSIEAIAALSRMVS